ncbi:MAG: hypothetical protein EXR79_14935 [Myxococcales bacterium]|nr:hypothetical protein [Myxococcales bacterium]
MLSAFLPPSRPPRRLVRPTILRRWLAPILAVGLGVAVPMWAADGDQDGLDDSWEAAWFGGLSQVPTGDPDKDGLDNATEYVLDTNPTDVDTDKDGLGDFAEVKPAAGEPQTSPTAFDTDGDTLGDGEEIQKWKTSPVAKDTDQDDLPDNVEVQTWKSNPLVRDSDNGFSDDGIEVLVDGTNPNDPKDDKLDTDGDLLSDWQEINVTKTDRFKKDTDGDGIDDGTEAKSKGLEDPTKVDTDGDGLSDSEEDLNKDGIWQFADNVYESNPSLVDTDGDGLGDGDEVKKYKSSPLLKDSDWDTLADGAEVAKGSSPNLPDSDGGGVLDPVEVQQGTNLTNPVDDVGKDGDKDGLSDAYETNITLTKPTDSDTDGDGLADAEEVFPLNDHYTCNPNDADSDDDGILDGKEGGVSIDGSAGKFKGGTCPICFDSDSDGLGDGVELGFDKPQVSPKQPNATTKPPFIADADPTSNTDPKEKDTDGDGLIDGLEDANKNGKWDPALGETDATKADTDGDGLDDGFETTYAKGGGAGVPLQPLDGKDGKFDNDGDGLSNLDEFGALTKQKDGKTVFASTNPRNKDTDGDGLGDMEEVLGTFGVAMLKSKGKLASLQYVKMDAGKGTEFVGSDPHDGDSDKDGVGDGAEDLNKNGKVDASETNPRDPDTDGDNLPDGGEDKNKNGAQDVGETAGTLADSDGDGLLDGLEINLYGTNPLAKDTDLDGLPDALEVGKQGDADPTTATNPKSKDSDGDGVQDAAEDTNKNGKVDLGETNPALADSDGDGLGDGLETAVSGDADPTTKTSPFVKDTDGDGLFDGTEDKNKNGKVDPGESDPNKKDTDGGGAPDGQELLYDGTNPSDASDDSSADGDGDGLKNAVEVKLGLDPKKPDTDGDTIGDSHEAMFGQGIDSDGDGTIDAKDLDSDDDGYPDAEEAGDADVLTPPVDTDGDALADFRDADSDGDGLPDKQEKALGTGRVLPDTDADGLNDGAELKVGASPLDTDSDDDGLQDGAEGPGDADGDGLIGVADVDSDNDGIGDGTEAGRTLATAKTLCPGAILCTSLVRRAFVPDADPNTTTNPSHVDSDGDGVRDGAEDTNHNGAVESGERPAHLNDPGAKPVDSDNDGLPDAEEAVVGTLANDADSDDDGVPDGAEWNPAFDQDGDGAACAADPDSDGDGLPDGLERGAGLATVATNLLVRNFRPDTDSASVTSPLLADSDGDGVRDGLEDFDGDGKVDAGEGDPNDVALKNAAADSDGDGLSDEEEGRAGSSVADTDSDDDGLSDGAEPDAAFDFDRDGLVAALDPDSDNDGLSDGQERGVAQPTAKTETAAGNFRADLDPASKTLPCRADSDDDGVADGNEDANLDGKADPGEGDAASGANKPAVTDTDQDGVGDLTEKKLGTKATDADTDDDGVPDGREANAAFDTDQDGVLNGLDEDSDGDGVYDGTEVGLTPETLPNAKDTNLGSGVFRADLDPTTTTLPLRADSDGGGLTDGTEDYSRDGRQDPGETNPAEAADDGAIDGDLDGDTLDNKTEVKLGLHPLKADTDGDGILDPVELDKLTAPADTDGDGKIDALDLDSDNDGLPDSQESGLDPKQLTLPQKPVDSDGDGMADYRDTDSDDDTLPDGDEVTKYKTNPRKTDTDGGGLRDDVEVLQTKTNPLDPADDTRVLESGALIRGTTPLSCGAGGARTEGGAAFGLALLAAALGIALRRSGRRRRLLALAVVSVVSGLGASAAVAAAEVGQPDVTGPRFNIDSQGILQVEAARQLDVGVASVGSAMSWAWRPLVVATDAAVLRNLVGWRLQGDVGASVRIYSGLTLAAHLPIGAFQEGSLPSLHGPQSGPVGAWAVGDAVLTPKFVIAADDADKWGFGLTCPVSLPTGDPVAYLGRPGPTFAPTLVASALYGPWRVAVNAGVRLQPTTTSFNVTDGPVFRWAAAGSLNPTLAQRSWSSRWAPQGWWLDASIEHESPLQAPFRVAMDQRVEATLAFTTPIGEDFFMTFGSGFGLWPGWGVPAYRPMAMLRYAEQPRIKARRASAAL